MTADCNIIQGDALTVLRTLPSESVHCVVTSPPYWGLRDYGVEGQLGLEKTPELYVARMVEVFREVRRVLREDGTCWCNLGDAYASSGTMASAEERNSTRSSRLTGGVTPPGGRAPTPIGLKPKDLCGIPWRLAFALQADGWWLRQDIIWHKPNPMPESVTDRCTKAHEYVFLLTKAERYFFDAEAIKEPASAGFNGSSFTSAYDVATKSGLGTVERIDNGQRNRRSVWTIPSEPFSDWTESIHWGRVSSGDASDGMRRIALKGCPVHDRRDSRGDEHGCASLNRNPGSEICHDSSPANAPACSSTHREPQRLENMKDCSDLSDSPIATPHSSQSHKTDLAAATIQPCRASEETTSRTDGTQALLGSFDSAGRTCASNIWPDDLADPLWEQIPYRTVRKSSNSVSCTCVIYQKITDKASHFATFPTALVKPCILAGTSARGCCPKCGAPWERVVERGDLKPSCERGNYGYNLKKNQQKEHVAASNLSACGVKPGMAYELTTIGWRPTCQCLDISPAEPFGIPLPPISCTVLDPFAGSGTVGEVALELGRSCILVELNPAYVELARKRTNVTPGLQLA